MFLSTSSQLVTTSGHQPERDYGLKTSILSSTELISPPHNVRGQRSWTWRKQQPLKVSLQICNFSFFGSLGQITMFYQKSREYVTKQRTGEDRLLPNIWILGSRYIRRGEEAAVQMFGENFGLRVQWFGKDGWHWNEVLPQFLCRALFTQSWTFWWSMLEVIFWDSTCN